MGSSISIKQEPSQQAVEEGRSINVSCEYDASIYNIQWYRQQQRSRPEFLLSITEGGSVHPTRSDFSAHINKIQKHVDLQISSAAETDSAVYYCAVRPGTNQYKIFFGSGTRLTLEPQAEVKPEYYELEKNGTRICLATDFTRHKATENNTLFKDYGSTVTGSGRFSQVAFLEGDGPTCNETGTEGQCKATVEPGPMVNAAALTINFLRLIFLKTVVFNVLMTLRLWISP